MKHKPRSLDDFTGDLRMSGDQYNYQNCPVCESQNYKVYVCSKTGKWLCFRCDTRGKVKLPGLFNVRAALLEKAKKVEWAAIDWPYTKPLSQSQRNILYNRYRITNPGIYNIQWTGTGFLIPYHDREYGLIYYTVRSLEGTPKYKNYPGKHPLYIPGYPWGYRDTSHLVLVEGQFDAIRVYQDTRLFVAAIGGKSLPDYLLHDMLDLKVKKVTIMLDFDTAGFEAAIKLQQKLSPFFDVRRIFSMSGEDPASLTPETLRRILE